MEVEYHGVVDVGTNPIWIQQLLGELNFLIEALTIIHYDNQRVIQVVNNPIAQSKMKHIEIHVH